MCKLVLSGFVFLLSILVAGGAFLQWVHNRDHYFYPGISIAGLPVDGLTYQQASDQLGVLTQQFTNSQGYDISLPEDIESTMAAEIVTPRWDQLQLSFQTQDTLDQAFELGKQGNIFYKLKSLWQMRHTETKVPLRFEYDQEQVLEYLDEVSVYVDEPGAKPTLTVNPQTQTIEIFRGEDGYVLDTVAFISELNQRLAALDTSPIPLQLTYQDNKISDTKASVTLLRAQQFWDKSIEVTVDETENSPTDTWTLESNDLIQFLSFESGYNLESIESYLDSLALGIDRSPQNALFEFEDNRVVDFQPAIPGLQLEVEASISKIVDALSQIEHDEEKDSVSVALTATQVPPEIDTADVNDLGITELLGKGESTFRGSIPGRIHNVALTASRLHGVLVAPGETFSFNQTIGEVSRATGYQSAYIIKDGRTMLGDGGGVCQDSTTLFRAILDAGLPVTQWKAHSYRVGYYEQNEKPGFDATVYAPSVDLKFENNTPGHILIQTKADTTNLTLEIELYGTDDGRVATISNYRQWDAVPAPPPLYQDDPTLAPGQVKQVDWASPGLKTKFDYVVVRDDETLFEKSFYSNFRPWQAVYLQGV